MNAGFKHTRFTPRATGQTSTLGGPGVGRLRWRSRCAWTGQGVRVAASLPAPVPQAGQRQVNKAPVWLLYIPRAEAVVEGACACPPRRAVENMVLAAVTAAPANAWCLGQPVTACSPPSTPVCGALTVLDQALLANP